MVIAMQAVHCVLWEPLLGQDMRLVWRPQSMHNHKKIITSLFRESLCARMRISSLVRTGDTALSRVGQNQRCVRASAQPTVVGSSECGGLSGSAPRFGDLQGEREGQRQAFSPPRRSLSNCLRGFAKCLAARMCTSHGSRHPIRYSLFRCVSAMMEKGIDPRVSQEGGRAGHWGGCVASANAPKLWSKTSTSGVNSVLVPKSS
jgi:hypothetical protein